jgi:hypothetical protein
MIDYSSQLWGIRDNTANNTVVMTQELDVNSGNIMWTKQSSWYMSGQTSSEHTKMNAYEQVVAQEFKKMLIPGMGMIIAKIDQNLFNEVTTKKPWNWKKYVVSPVFNKTYNCFEITNKNISIATMDATGTIGYSSYGEKTMKYIKKQQYTERLQLKNVRTNDIINSPVMKNIQKNIQAFDKISQPFISMVNIYANNPWEWKTSDMIIKELKTKWWYSDQLDVLKRNLSASKEQIDLLLLDIKKNTSWVLDPQEKALLDAQKSIEDVWSYITQMTGLLNYSNWEPAQARHMAELMKTVVAIAVAVVAAVATWGAGWIVVTAALTTAGWMLGARWYDEFHRFATNTQWLNNNLGSDIGDVLRGKKSWSSVWPQLLQEWVMGTVTTAVFMGAGQFAGKSLNAYVAQNAWNTSFSARVLNKVWATFSNLKRNFLKKDDLLMYWKNLVRNLLKKFEKNERNLQQTK